MKPEDLVALSVADLVSAYEKGDLSPVDVTRATLDHVEATNPALNALFSIRPEAALAQASEAEERWRRGEPMGLLDGVPVTVKDSVAMKGWPYHHGIGATRNAPPSNYDSPPAARLMEAGAIIFAKTAMPDCGLMAAGINTLMGVTRNPWGMAWNTGGSSAGAGASLASGMGYLSVGSDIAGSVRLPASHCGLVALKPTQGRIPHLSSDIMRSAGPMARTTADMARMMTVLSGPDARDAWSLAPDGVQYHQHLKRDVKGLRIGVLTELGFGPKAEAPVLAAVAAAAEALAAQGAEILPFTSPFDYDAYAPIDLYCQVRGYAEMTGLPPHPPEDFNAYVRDWCLPAANITAVELNKALQAIAKARGLMLAAFEGFDYVISPTLPVVNFPAEAPGVFPEQPLAHTTFTALYNQTCQPASSICFGFDERGLPIGVQVIGHRFDDLGVIQVTQALEDTRAVAMDWPVVPRA